MGPDPVQVSPVQASPVRRIVVLRALGLGDLLTAVPALRALRRAHPAARLSLAAPGWLAPLLPLVGGVDELVPTAPLAPLDPSLRGADLAVNLHGRGPQSTALLRASDSGRLLAYGTGDGQARWRDDEHEVVRWCRLLVEAGIPADPGDLALLRPAAVPAPAGPFALVHPGSAAASRRWPVERWAAVVSGLPHPVLVSAGPGEQDRAAQVAALGGLPPEAVVSGLPLTELAALVDRAALLLASDTGVAHLATALGTPSVVLFGPVAPAQWGPPPDRTQHVALWGGIRSDNAGTGPAPGLLALHPAEVLAAGRGLLDRRTG
ncbi:MAG TPA: glycosyltransferase family 9 protein [Mycobacteriales bacterium]|nr:glycosyltransferase family 9 protein [Mycobacteriales bacterium]